MRFILVVVWGSKIYGVGWNVKLRWWILTIQLLMNENTFLVFQIEKELHDEILKRLLETDPETVDYVLRKKSARTSLIE